MPAKRFLRKRDREKQT